MLSGTNSAPRFFAITPDDAAALNEQVRGLYVGGGGDVVVTGLDGNGVTFVGVQPGTILPVQTRFVKATGTTATNMVGLA